MVIRNIEVMANSFTGKNLIKLDGSTFLLLWWESRICMVKSYGCEVNKNRIKVVEKYSLCKVPEFAGSSLKQIQYAPFSA